jgi:hypothetical protein
MKKTLLSLAAGGLVSLVVSNPASAAIKLIVDNASVQQPVGSAVTQFVDVYFDESAPIQNEKMNNILLYLYMSGPGTGGSGVHIGTFDGAADTPSGNPHPFVFPGVQLVDFGSSDTVFAAGASSSNNTTAVADVVPGSGVARIPIVIPAGTPVGNYSIKVDDKDPGELGFTSFGSADESTFPGASIPFTSQDGVLTVTPAPEPAALGLFAVAGVGCLLRRRRSA